MLAQCWPRLVKIGQVVAEIWLPAFEGLGCLLRFQRQKMEFLPYVCSLA